MKDVINGVLALVIFGTASYGCYWLYGKHEKQLAIERQVKQDQEKATLDLEKAKLEQNKVEAERRAEESKRSFELELEKLRVSPIKAKEAQVEIDAIKKLEEEREKALKEAEQKDQEKREIDARIKKVAEGDQKKAELIEAWTKRLSSAKATIEFVNKDIAVQTAKLITSKNLIEGAKNQNSTCLRKIKELQELERRVVIDKSVTPWVYNYKEQIVGLRLRIAENEALIIQQQENIAKLNRELVKLKQKLGELDLVRDNAEKVLKDFGVAEAGPAKQPAPFINPFEVKKYTLLILKDGRKFYVDKVVDFGTAYSVKFDNGKFGAFEKTDVQEIKENVENEADKKQ